MMMQDGNYVSSLRNQLLKFSIASNRTCKVR